MIDCQSKKEDQSILNKIELKDEERTRCEIWSRVMGYFRPVDQWNIGKKQEYKDRKTFIEPEL